MLSVAVVFLLLIGCGPKANQKGGVSGTIIYKGQPINGGVLMLYPAAGGDQGGLPIPISQDGTFGSGDITPGDYKVVVHGNTAAAGASGGQAGTKPTIPFPNKYKDVKTTTLTMNVTAGSQKVPLEMKD